MSFFIKFLIFFWVFCTLGWLKDVIAKEPGRGMKLLGSAVSFMMLLGLMPI